MSGVIGGVYANAAEAKHTKSATANTFRFTDGWKISTFQLDWQNTGALSSADD